VKGKTAGSIIALEPLAIKGAEAVSVILLKEVDPANPGAVLIALLLSMALVGNFACGMVAARAAGFVRQIRALETRGSRGAQRLVAVVSGSREAIGCGRADIAGVDLAAPASASAM
jgi:hypothetical protein